MPNLIHLGSEVKMKNDGTIEGYLVLFGNPSERDFVGDYFTQDTDFDLENGKGKATLYFNHGLDPVLKNHKLNNGVKADLSIHEKGVWVQGKLDEANEYDAMVIELIKRRESEGKSVGWSSGSPSHLVRREHISDGVYRIKSWSLGSDASITHTPADYRNKATYKSIELLPIEFSDLSASTETEASAQTETVKAQPDDHGNGSKNNSISSEVIMTEQQNNTETQVTPLEQPVTREEIKGMFTEFGQELINSLKPQTESLPPVPAKSSIVDKGVNIHPNPIGGGDDSDGTKAFFHYVTTAQKNSSLKALEDGTDSEGGYLVPTPVHSEVIQRRDLGSIIRLADFARFTTSNGTYNIPVEGDDSAAMDSTAEEAAATQNDPVFGVAAGALTKYTREVRYSDELEMWSTSDFMGFIGDRVAREMAKAENAALDVELFANGTAALTLDSLSAIGAAEVPEIVGLMPASWENGSIWNMAKSTHALIEGLTGDDFLFASTPAGMRNADGSRELWSYPLYYNDQMDAMGADNEVISFYNPNAVGVIDPAQSMGLSVLVDPYTLASSGQHKLVYKFWVDVIVMQAQAVLEIICPSS